MDSTEAREPKVNNFYKNGFDNFLEFRKASKVEYGGLTAVVLERLERSLPTGKIANILDVGCGDGYITSLLMRDPYISEMTNFYLLDQSRMAIEEARKRVPRAKGFINKEIIEYLSTTVDKEFDAILALNSLYGIKIDIEFVNKLMSKLEPDGVFILALATGRSHFVELQKKYWSKAHADPFYRKNVFDDAEQIFGNVEGKIIRTPLETTDLSIEQCQKIALFMLYADKVTDTIEELAEELKELGEIGLEYGFLSVKREDWEKSQNKENLERRLFRGVREGDFGEVRNLIEKEEVDVNARDDIGGTLLSRAISRLNFYRGEYELIVQVLLESGADVNAKGVHGETPLIEAARYDDIKTVKRLLEAGADSNALVEYGKERGVGEFVPPWGIGATALIFACANGDEQMVELLLEHGANVNVTSERHGTTALNMAYGRELNGLVELLIGRVDIKNEIEQAIKKKNSKLIKFLEEYTRDYGLLSLSKSDRLKGAMENLLFIP